MNHRTTSSSTITSDIRPHSAIGGVTQVEEEILRESDRYPEEARQRRVLSRQAVA